MHNTREVLLNISNTMIRVLNELTSHSEILRSIFQKIEELTNKFTNQELLNKDTQEFKNRDEFYRKLSDYVSILS
ncbi:unnamed protein product [Rotaria sp. Silwood1]|nr:unnamed protein product [Rotaria sp. Silwood1]